MNQVIFSQSRGDGSPRAYYVIDRRVPAFQVPAFYVTEQRFATRMDRAEADRLVAGNAELRNHISSGVVAVEYVKSELPGAG